MTRLGDFFSKDFKQKFAAANLIVGSVIVIPVNDTNPPKHKYLIVVGNDDERIFFATVFINTEINLKVINTVELQNLQVWIDSTKCGLVKHDCYVDCSKISERNIQEVANYISKKPHAHIGTLEEEFLIQVMGLLKTAPTITPKLKKRYNL